MKSIFKNLIQEILTEMFVQSISLKEINQGTKITILFQNNKIEIEKTNNKFKVLNVSNPERVKVGDIIHFIQYDIKVGDSPKCYIYRKNEIDKLKKINMVHEFSTIKTINLI